jgi:hypothetical protein
VREQHGAAKEGGHREEEEEEEKEEEEEEEDRAEKDYVPGRWGVELELDVECSRAR